MSDSPDLGRYTDGDGQAAASERTTSERPHLDERREMLDAEMGKIIEDIIAATAHHESVGSALESIALKAFEKGYDQDTLIKKITKLRIFEPDGVLVKVLKDCIGQEIDKHYASLGYDRVGGSLDKTRRQLANHALNFFLKHMGSEDCITSFFKNLIDGRYRLHKPLLTPSDKPGSVSKNALLEWAVSSQTLARITSRMSDFVKPVITEAYGVYIAASPGQYVRAVFSNVIGIDKDGGVKIYFDNMDKLVEKVCSSINFETFWEILMSHKDLLAKEYHERFEGKRFYATLVEDWKDYIHQRWNSIGRGKAAPEGERNGGGAVNFTRAATAVRTRRVCSAILPPGAIDNGGSGSTGKAQVILTLPTGQNVDKFFVKTDMFGDPKSLRAYIRGKLVNSNSSVAQALRSHGIHLEERAIEIDTIVDGLIAAGSRKVQGVSKKQFGNGGRRHYGKKH